MLYDIVELQIAWYNVNCQESVLHINGTLYQGPLLLTWINFIPNMDE